MWRAVGVTLAGLILLVGFAVGAVVLEGRAIDFEARGTHVPGVVISVGGGHRQSWTADVRYRAGDTERAGSIRIDGPAYRAGDPITVIYDPSDPDRIAAPGLPQDPAPAVVAMALVLLVGGISFIAGLVQLVRAALTRPGRHAAPGFLRTGRSRFPSGPSGRHSRRSHRRG